MSVTYRPAKLEDAPIAAEVMTAAYPTLTQDPVVTRFRWEQVRKGYEVGRFIAERDDRPVAFLAWMHGPWEKLPDRHCEVEVWLDRNFLDTRLLEEMWTWVGDAAIAEGSRLLLAYCAEDEAEMLESLETLGYSVERRGKLWELDLAAHGERLRAEAADARRTLEAGGYAVTTVEDWSDPERRRKLYTLNAQTVQDVPHSLPIVTEAFEDFERRTKAPDRRDDRWWIALQGDEVIAMSFLKYPPVRGTVWTGFTCAAREYRGRGIARAVKLQTLAQAVELGVPSVWTDNDAENAPMLHINAALGYTLRPGWVEHHKRVEKIGAQD